LVKSPSLVDDEFKNMNWRLVLPFLYRNNHPGGKENPRLAMGPHSGALDLCRKLQYDQGNGTRFVMTDLKQLTEQPRSLRMFLRWFVASCIVVLLAGRLLAFEVPGTVQKVDAEKGTLVIRVNGQDRHVKADASIKVLDKEGKELADGLKSKELKEGVEATFTIEQEKNEPIVKAVRLGKRETTNPKEKSSVGLKPLTEMTAEDRYKGEDGGLYGGGKNEPPEAHQTAAIAACRRIVPLDEQGKPSKDGKIVLMSVGMSNTAGVFTTFKEIADRDPEKSARVVIVNGAVGGAGARSWSNGPHGPWDALPARLKEARVSPQQVQVVWIKHAEPMPSPDATPLEYARDLKKWLASIVRTLKSEYPNVRIVYLSSRTYGGYNAAGLRLVNPEPFAYESAFSVRWLIQEQIKGEAKLNHDPEKGAVVAPLLLWGPYLWADGVTPRKADGLAWERKDFTNDGVHPTQKGREKSADLLLRFFKNDAGAKTWFLNK
jgi:hypothetical protein